MAARYPATANVAHAHRLAGAIVSFLSDVIEVTSSSIQEDYRLAASMVTAWVDLAC